MEKVPETVQVTVPYQVFINYRGADVKKTCARHLYDRLRSLGLRVFLDEKEIVTGDALSSAVIGAIQSASVHVTIFSEGYAKSKWCLDELCMILRSHHERNTKIIPVFSDVEPLDLRYIESGRYADAFEKHQHKGSVAMEVLHKWKTALNDASHIAGLLFKTNESDYVGIMEKIVRRVLELVHRREAINSESLFHYLGQETATFLASCGILSQAWEELRLAINSENFSLNEHEGVAYVVFPSFHDREGFIVKDSKYGACNIQTDNKVFSGCLKGNDDQLALVHQGALKLLLHIMESTDFHAKLQIYTDSKQEKLKPIIFVGHSLGGAVATLATLWVLEKRLRQSSPFCITFGSPLVGDARLVEAVGRENWGGNFCHVVSKNDIVPRVLLAPFESTAQPLNALLPYWLAKITNDRNDGPDFLIQDAYKALLLSVCESNASPYKPFGTFMFCSSNGAACIANSKTVLAMLLLTIQSQETSSEKSRQDCLLEHIRYGSILEHVIQISTRGIMGISANSNSESSDEMGISLELEAVGIGAQNHRAWNAIQEAGSIENKHNTNVTKLAIELRQQQLAMAELEWYKERCEMEELFYYDSFKNREDDMDARTELGNFWDKIIKMWDRHELPSDFQSQNKWINAGTAYRKLVEPLDIAHYYRMSKGKGNYLSDGRPTRHKVLQKWMEEKEKTSGPVPSLSRKKTSSPLKKIPSLSRDSCFCAHVEEALKDFEHLQRGEYERLKSLEEFEHYVTRMIEERGVSSDVIARIGADSAPSSSHHLSSGSPLQVLKIKVSSPNTS